VKPYYDHGGVTVFHGDCRDVSLFLPAFRADVVIADPPYGDTSINWDRRVSGWATTMKNSLSLLGSMWVFGSFRYFFEAAAEFEAWTLAQDVIWEKQNGSSFHADRFKRVHEHAIQFYRGEWRNIYKNPVTTQDATARAVRRKQRPPHTGGIAAGSYISHDGGPRLMRSVIQIANCHGIAEHPTQKPVGIIDPLLRYSCKPDGLVLDAFMGSGSVLVAAKRLGMRAIEIEIEERYCEVAARRLSQEVFTLTASGEATA
jgi:site-specific DNA-methyltransferase (adenine-specific)